MTAEARAKIEAEIARTERYGMPKGAKFMSGIAAETRVSTLAWVLSLLDAQPVGAPVVEGKEGGSCDVAEPAFQGEGREVRSHAIKIAGALTFIRGSLLDYRPLTQAEHDAINTASECLAKLIGTGPLPGNA